MSKNRVKTMIRIPKTLHERLTQAADERDVSMNWLACRAIDDFLTHLIPADELRLTRRESTSDLVAHFENPIDAGHSGSDDR